MADASSMQLWSARLTYVGVSFAVIFVQILPIGTTPQGFAGPDLLMCLTFVCATRRPEYVPAVSIACVMLLADFLLQRPPGLAAALTLAGAEFLKRQSPSLRDQSFFAEWLAVTTVLFAVFALHRLTVSLFVLEEIPIKLLAMQVAGTVIAYPFVVFFCSLALGLRKKLPGEMAAPGRNL